MSRALPVAVEGQLGFSVGPLAIESAA